MKKSIFFIASDGNKTYYLKGCKSTDSSSARIEGTVTSIDKDGNKGTEEYLKIFKNIILITEISEYEYDLNA